MEVGYFMTWYPYETGKLRQIHWIFFATIWLLVLKMDIEFVTPSLMLGEAMLKTVQYIKFKKEICDGRINKTGKEIETTETLVASC